MATLHRTGLPMTLAHIHNPNEWDHDVALVARLVIFGDLDLDHAYTPISQVWRETDDFIRDVRAWVERNNDHINKQLRLPGALN